MALPSAPALRFITPADPLYAGEVELRFRVLREPLGYRREDVAFPFDGQSLHLVALLPGREGPEVVGCVLFHPEGDGSGGRLYQMAVRPDLQGQGLGARLVRHLEAELRARGVRHVHLHARASVVPFYERLGYAVEGEPYVEVGIPHRNMARDL